MMNRNENLRSTSIVTHYQPWSTGNNSPAVTPSQSISFQNNSGSNSGQVSDHSYSTQDRYSNLLNRRRRRRDGSFIYYMHSRPTDPRPTDPWSGHFSTMQHNYSGPRSYMDMNRPRPASALWMGSQARPTVTPSNPFSHVSTSVVGCTRPSLFTSNGPIRQRIPTRAGVRLDAPAESSRPAQRVYTENGVSQFSNVIDNCLQRFITTSGRGNSRVPRRRLGEARLPILNNPIYQSNATTSAPPGGSAGASDSRPSTSNTRPSESQQQASSAFDSPESAHLIFGIWQPYVSCSVAVCGLERVEACRGNTACEMQVWQPYVGCSVAVCGLERVEACRGNTACEMQGAPNSKVLIVVGDRDEADAIRDVIDRTFNGSRAHGVFRRVGSPSTSATNTGASTIDSTAAGTTDSATTGAAESAAAGITESAAAGTIGSAAASTTDAGASASTDAVASGSSDSTDAIASGTTDSTDAAAASTDAGTTPSTDAGTSADTSAANVSVSRSQQGVKRKRKQPIIITSGGPHTVQEFNKVLLRLLECPVCLESMEPPLAQCRRGHLVCSECLSRLYACPVCRSDFSTTRNRAMEEVTDLLRYPCRYDCGRQVRLKRRALHESSCPQRLYRCPLPSCDMHSLFSYNELVSHAQSQHATVLKTGTSTVLQFKSNVDFSGDWIMMAMEECFYLCLTVDMRANGLYFYVSYIGPKKRATDFNYQVTLIGKQCSRKLVYCRSTHSDLESYNETAGNRDCFTLSMDQARNFLKPKDKNEETQKYLELIVEIIKCQSDPEEPEEPVAETP